MTIRLSSVLLSAYSTYQVAGISLLHSKTKTTTAAGASPMLSVLCINLDLFFFLSVVLYLLFTCKDSPCGLLDNPSLWGRHTYMHVLLNSHCICLYASKSRCACISSEVCYSVIWGGRTGTKYFKGDLNPLLLQIPHVIILNKYQPSSVITCKLLWTLQFYAIITETLRHIGTKYDGHF